MAWTAKRRRKYRATINRKRRERQEADKTFGQAKPLLREWGKELARDEVISAFKQLEDRSPSNVIYIWHDGKLRRFSRRQVMAYLPDDEP